MRSKLINKLAVYNPFFKIVYVETNMENIIARRREEIPIRKLNKMRRMLDMPMMTEVHEVNYFRNN